MTTKSFGKYGTVALATLMSTSLFLSACGDKSGATETPAASPAAAAKEKVDGGEITTAYLGDPQGFIRFWATSTTSSEVIELVFSSLYKFNEKQEIVPDLAVGQPTFSDDKLQMTIKIRNDVKFSDGKPVTADDVVFTYNVALNPDYKGPRKGTFTSVAKVEKVDDTTVKFILKEPNAGYIDMMPYNILPQHILKDVPVKDMDKSDFMKNPIGSGPYKLDEWKKGQFLKFSRVDSYYGGKPSIDKINIKILGDANTMMAQLQTGEINQVTVPVDNLSVIENYAKQSGKIKLEKGVKTSSYSYIGWNLKNPLFQDKAVRQALTMLMDRQGIIDGVIEGQGTIMHAQTPPTYWTFTDNVPKFNYDVDKAKKMLADAGWKDSDSDGVLDKDGKKFEFEMTGVQGNKVREKAMTVVQQQLKKAGIIMNIRMLESSAYSKAVITDKKFESVFGAWSISGDPNPRGTWHSSEVETGMNITGYSNPEVDKLIDEDLNTFDKNKRKELLNKVDALVAEDQAYTFLYSGFSTNAYPSNLAGYNPQRDGLKEIEKWYFTK
ncbi:peptide-binding protein [Paenibacillus sp. N1-5-1-14]|uniref:peptide-binding protein n=1 Tax=Paenibacillus radicibacter TaxID=2972488 RepID=UPI0021594130|nr:peptide-binding protein [Paenibacillus radicibacter]MCR8644532.1 peptide-binding protein [Paenibacillus radicibacter]